jgi:hypothetical protein
VSEFPVVPAMPSLPSRFETPAPLSYLLPDLNLTVAVVPLTGLTWTFPSDPPTEGEEA